MTAVVLNEIGTAVVRKIIRRQRSGRNCGGGGPERNCDAVVVRETETAVMVENKQ